MSTYSYGDPSVFSDSRYMDEKIKECSKLLETVSHTERANLYAKVLGAKLMKEKLVAMTALAKAQSILAEMDVLVAENNMKTAMEQLDKFTKDHGQVPAEKKTDNPEPSELKLQMEPNIPAIIGIANSTKKNTLTENKENTNIAIEIKPHTESEIVQEPSFHSHTSTEKTKKRKHSDGRSKSKKREKKRKTSHDTKMTNSDASTLQNLTLSPISKITASSVGMGNMGMPPAYDKQFECSKPIDYVSHRILQDDENTSLLEGPSVKRSSHQEAINLSKALQKVMPPKDSAQSLRYCQSVQDDLSQCPRLTNMKLLFEDEPTASRKAGLARMKTKGPESDLLNNSTDNLVNDLFRDIMEANQGAYSNSTKNEVTIEVSHDSYHGSYSLRSFVRTKIV